MVIKPLKHYPGYGISKDGRIWSRKQRHTGELRATWKPLKRTLDQKGYYVANLYCGQPSKLHRVKIHRLLWQTFIGSLEPGYVINHINGDKTDNALDNLEMVTQKENMKCAWEMGLMADSRPPMFDHTTHSGVKFTEEQVRSIRNRYKKPCNSLSSLAREYHVHPSTIHDIVTRKTWKHLK